MLRNPGLRKSVEQPVLDLNFAASQIGSNGAPDGRMNDFNRGSNAWFVDSDGLVKKSPHNLLLQSEDFGTTWSAIGDVTVATNEIVAPDGTTTADKISSANFAAGGNHIRQGSGTVDAGTYTASVFVKAGSLDTFKFRIVTFAPSTVDANSIFDLSTGEWTSINGNHTVSTEAYPNDWFRLSLTFSNPASGAVQPRFAASSGSGFIYLWGAQLSQHTTLPVDNPYIKTEGSAAYAARLDHDPEWFMSAAQEQNLFTNSEMLDETGDTGWTATRTVVTKDSTEDPNGDTTAEKVLEDSTASNSHFVRSPDFTVTEGKSYTASAYVKVAAGTERLFRLAFTAVDSAFTYIFAQFDLQSGTVQFANTDASSITNVGNGWYRISITETASATADTAEVQFAFVEKGGTASYDGDGTSGFFVWGAQVEVGTSPGTYHRTEGAPYYGPGATPKGLLIEEQRANLISYSEDFSASGLNPAQSPGGSLALTHNDALAPDGTTTATKLVATSSGGSTGHLLYKVVSIDNDTTVTASVFMKNAGQGWGYLQLANTGYVSTKNVYADLENGVLGASSDSSATIEDYGNGWYRVSVTNTTDSDGGNDVVAIGVANGDAGTVFTGDDTNGIYIWGWQKELGSFPTSYIKNVGTGATRNADVAVMGPTTGGTELVTNGTFDTDSDWTLSAGWSITGGEAVASSAAQYRGITSTTLSLVAGRRYRASMDVASYTAGSVDMRYREGGSIIANTGDKSATGTFTIDFTCTDAASPEINIQTRSSGSNTFAIDNVSVRELYPFEQYRPDQGTMVVAFDTQETNSRGPWWFSRGGASSTGWGLRLQSTTTIDSMVRDSSNFNTMANPTITPAFDIVAASYEQRASDTFCSVATADSFADDGHINDIDVSVDTLDIGNCEIGGSNTGIMSGHIKRLQYFPIAMNDETKLKNMCDD